MSVTMADVFTFMVNEIGAWVNWLSSWSLYGIPFLFYFMGFIIMGLLFDFIFG